MRAYAIRRLLLMVPLLLLVTFAVASLMRLVPGDPATLALGESASKADLVRFRAAYHLNDPLPVQYLHWWSDTLHGNLGKSVVQRTTVTKELRNRLPSTLELVVLSMALTVLIGVPFGIISAVKQYSVLDYGIRLLSIGGLSVPSFWLGTLVLLLPAIWWGYLPPLTKVALTRDPARNLQQYALPSLTLAIGASAVVMRLTRSAVLEVLRNDYVRTARAKGLRERVVIQRHVIKNSLIPVITVIGLQVAGLIGGSVIIESIFNLPGVGVFFINSITARDYPSIQGMVLFFAVTFMLVNLTVDLCYGVLDPRIRYT
jgi:peptide/nickel transport system permease protein